MAISSGNSVLHSDINAIFSAFNTLINSQSWGINAIPAADIPAQGSKVDDANITVLNNKIDEFNSNEYLSTKDWWVKSTVTEGTLLQATDLTNIINSANYMAQVVCKNKATNVYGEKTNCCDSHDCNQSGHAYGRHGRNCNQGGHGYGRNSRNCNQGGHGHGSNSNNCGQGGHGYGNNGNNCNQAGHGYGTLSSRTFSCSFICQYNYHNCLNSALRAYSQKRGPQCSWQGHVVWNYICFWCSGETNAAGHTQCCNTHSGISAWNATESCTFACSSNTCGSQTCSHTACTSQTCGSQSCSHTACTSQTCGSQSCSYTNCTSQTCGSQTCSYETCSSQTCSAQTCSNTASCVHGGCSAYTETIDITCNLATNTYND